MWKVINFVQIVFIALFTALTAITGFILLIPFFWRPSLGFLLLSKMWSFVVLLTCGVGLEVYGQRKVLLKQGQIFVSNHSSHFDIPILFQALPVAVYFISKKELKKVPFMGWYMAIIGMIFIDRENREKAMKSMRKAGRKINSGKSVISFPEGTRSKDGEVKLFKKGTFIISRESNVPIVPVAIDGAFKILAPGNIDIRPGVVRVNIGDPIDPGDYAHLNTEEFANHIRQEVIKLREKQLSDRAQSAGVA